MTWQVTANDTITQTGTDNEILLLPTNTGSNTIPAGNILQSHFVDGFNYTDNLILKSTQLKIQGTIDKTYGHESIANFTFIGTKLNELLVESSGKFNLSGFEDNGEYLQNVSLTFGRRPSNFFKQLESGLRIAGECKLRSLVINICTPIFVEVGSVVEWAGLHIQSADWNAGTTSGASLRIFEKIIEQDNYYDGLVQYQAAPLSSANNTYRKIGNNPCAANFLNRRQGALTDGTSDIISLSNPSTIGGAVVSGYGFPRITIRNAVQGLGLSVIIWRFLNDGTDLPDLPVVIPQFQSIKFSASSNTQAICINTTDIDSGNRIAAGYYYIRTSGETVVRDDFSENGQMLNSFNYDFIISTGAIESNELSLLMMVYYNNSLTNITSEDLRIDNQSETKHTFYLRAYGFQFQAIEVELASAGITKTVDINNNIVEDNQVIYDSMFFDSTQAIDNANLLYSVYKFLSSRDTADGLAMRAIRGYNTEPMISEGFKITTSGWDIVLAETTNVSMIQFSTTDIIIYNGSSFDCFNGLSINGGLFYLDNDVKTAINGTIPIDIRGDIDWLIGDKRQYLYTFYTEAHVTADYKLQVYGVKDSIDTLLNEFETSGNQTLLLGIYKDDYDNLKVVIRGGEVETTTTDLDVNNFQNSFSVNQLRDAQAEWLAEWATKNVALTASNISIVGDMTGRGLDFLVWAIHHRADLSNLNADDYVSVANSIITIKKHITNATFNILLPSSYLGLIFLDSNESYLIGNLPVPAETTTKATYDISALQNEDLFTIQEQDESSTLAEYDIAGVLYRGVFEKSKTYQARVYRTGWDSQVLSIDNNTRSAIPIFTKDFGEGNYTGISNLTNVVKYQSHSIVAIADFTSDDNFSVGLSENEINYFFEQNRNHPFGILADHLIARYTKGILFLNYPIVSDVKAHTETQTDILKLQNSNVLKVNGTSEGINCFLVPSASLSDVDTSLGTIQIGSKIEFLNDNDTVYASTISLAILQHVSNSLFISVSNSLDPDKTGRNYRHKKIRFSTSHIEYVEKLTIRTINQYGYLTYDSSGIEIENNVEKEISAIPRPIEVINVEVDGGYTADDRTRSIDTNSNTANIESKVNQLENTQYQQEINMNFKGDSLFGIVHGLFIASDVQYGELISKRKTFFFGKFRDIIDISWDNSYAPEPKVVFVFEVFDNETASDFPTSLNIDIDNIEFHLDFESLTDNRITYTKTVEGDYAYFGSGEIIIAILILQDDRIRNVNIQPEDTYDYFTFDNNADKFRAIASQAEFNKLMLDVPDSTKDIYKADVSFLMKVANFLGWTLNYFKLFNFGGKYDKDSNYTNNL